MKLSLGPVLYFWSPATLNTFYERALKSHVNTVYLGEVVCSKRRSYNLSCWLEWAEKFRDAGKEVILSSLTLIESESELGAMKQLCQQKALSIEANDMGMAQLAIEQGLPFVGGSTLNLYNAATVAYLARQGMVRWIPPYEMSRQSLQTLLQEYKALGAPAIQTEVMSYGRLPLAHSARCYTARFLDIPKDQCEFRCIEYPQGTPLISQEGQGLFQINGIQTQSFHVCNLLHEKPTMEALGVDVMRFHAEDIACLDKIDAFHAGMAGAAVTIPVLDAQSCNGYWFGKPGIVLQENAL